MRLRAKANNGYSQNKQFDVLRGKLPADCICKADQWVLLNRCQVRVPAASCVLYTYRHKPFKSLLF